MTYQITEEKLYSLISRAAEAGANRALTALGLKKSQISQREAFVRFGKNRVTQWREQGLIKPVKTKRILYYYLQELEMLQNVCDLATEENLELLTTDDANH